MRKANAIGVLLLVLPSCGDWPGGMRPSYQPRDHDPELTAYARTALPIIRSIQRHREKTGRLPTCDELQLLLPSDESAPKDCYVYRGWLYRPSAQYYTLARRLGWDPSLRFCSKDGSWTFCPGDGSPEKPVVLQPEPIAPESRR